MRGRRLIGCLRGFLATTIVAVAALAWPGVATAVPPAPCDPAVVIQDPGTDGHHEPTDVLRAWLSEAETGNLKAVIEVDLGNWDAEHDDPIIVAGYAFLFTVNGVTRFVRLSVDEDFNDTYEYGTYTFPGTFTQQGLTTGRREPGPLPPTNGNGTAIIDVPTSLADNGDLLTDTFVLTYDGIVGGVPVWVDQAPGGETPTQQPRGPSFLVGQCAGVRLNVPTRITGARMVTIFGRVLGGTEGDQVVIRRKTKSGTVTSQTTIDAEGDYSINAFVRETTTVSAVSGQFESQDKTITVKSVVTIKANKRASGKTKITGKTNPALPGKVKLYKTTAFFATASKEIDGGRFSFPAKRLKPGRYEVIYTPSQGRALRDISNKVTVR